MCKSSSCAETVSLRNICSRKRIKVVEDLIEVEALKGVEIPAG